MHVKIVLMFGKLLGDPNARKLRRYSPLISDINILEEDLISLTDDELRSKTNSYREKLSKTKALEEERNLLDDLLPEAFALVREASKRVLGMRPFDVQLVV